MRIEILNHLLIFTVQNDIMYKIFKYYFIIERRYYIMSVGFYVGTFDIFTNGHLLVTKKSAKLFDKVIIGMGINEKKGPRQYNIDLMKNAIEKTLISEGLLNVDVTEFSGLTVVEAKKYNTTYLIRGVRTLTDYQDEEDLAVKNEKLSGIDTIYIRSGNLGYISSSFVKGLIAQNWDVSEYVPKPVYDLIMKEKSN